MFAVTMTIALCDQLTISMGPSIKQHVRTIAPGLFSNFGDSKVGVLTRSATFDWSKIGQTGLTDYK